MTGIAEQSRLRRAEGQFYQNFLADMHASLDPKWYLEIGTQSGKSLALSKARSVSVDPAFVLKGDVTSGRPETHFFQQTSDDFFASNALKRLGVKFDLAFLDGMHLYDFLLRDFINTEPVMQNGGHIVLHDCMPWEPLMASRDRRLAPTRAWTGDVWKVVPILQEFRPDLKIQMFDAEPTGLVVVSGLDPKNTALAEAYDNIIKKWDNIDDVEKYVSCFEITPTGASPWTARRPAEAARPLTFAIQTPVPRPKLATRWGDHHFAVGLAEALERLGHKARVQSRREWEIVESDDEIDIALRGRQGYDKRSGHPLMYWVISSSNTLRPYQYPMLDHLFAAGEPLAKRMAARIGQDRVSLLPQAFDPQRMKLPEKKIKRDGIVFIGTQRGYGRPMADYALKAGIDLKLWGGGWSGEIAEAFLQDTHMENAKLGEVYASAEIVLNDHKEIMADDGIVSNRIFDALACGAAVITDPVAWMPDDIAEFVDVVDGPEALKTAVTRVRKETAAKKKRREEFALQMRTTHSFDARAKEIIAKARSLAGVSAP